MSFAKKRPEALAQLQLSSDGQTFQVNPSAPKTNLLPAEDFNSMFSPLSIERIFRPAPSQLRANGGSGQDDSDDDREPQTDTLIKMLWSDSKSIGGNGGGNLTGGDDTFRRIINDGINLDSIKAEGGVGLVTSQDGIDTEGSDGELKSSCDASEASSIKFPDLTATYGQNSSRQLRQGIGRQSGQMSALKGPQQGPVGARNRRPGSLLPIQQRPSSCYEDRGFSGAQALRLGHIPELASSDEPLQRPPQSAYLPRSTMSRSSNHARSNSTDITTVMSRATGRPDAKSAMGEIARPMSPKLVRGMSHDAIPRRRQQQQHKPLDRVRQLVDTSIRKRATTMPTKPDLPQSRQVGRHNSQRHRQNNSSTEAVYRGHHHHHQQGQESLPWTDPHEGITGQDTADDAACEDAQNWDQSQYESIAESNFGNAGYGQHRLASPSLRSILEDPGSVYEFDNANRGYADQGGRSDCDNLAILSTGQHQRPLQADIKGAANFGPSISTPSAFGHHRAASAGTGRVGEDKDDDNNNVIVEECDTEALNTILHCLNSEGRALHQLTSINLSGCGIHSLSGMASIFPSLDSINLNGNKLTTLDGLPGSTAVLSAAMNWISSPEGDDLSHAQGDGGSSSGGGIKGIYLYADFLPHLEHVDLSDNQITNIGIFSGLRHLRTLIVDKNRLTSLSRLRRCPRLETLRARENSITSLDLNWPEFPELANIDLYRNRITSLSSIDKSFKLRSMNLECNDITHIHIRHPVPSLRVLRLSENTRLFRHASGVVDIAKWVNCFPGLKTLYMDGCQARYLGCNSSHEKVAASPWLSLYNLSVRGQTGAGELVLDLTCFRHLRNLYVSKQRVSLPRALPALPHLVQLELWNVGLTRLPPNLSSAALRLELLDVSNNPDLRDLSPIYHCHSLRILRCRYIGWGSSQPRAPIRSNGDGDKSNINGRKMEKTMGISRTGGGGDGDGANTFEQIQSLSRLQRLAELDFRFNTFNARFYAPQSAADPLGMHGHCAGASGGVGNGENPLVSPVLPSGGGGGGSNQLPGLVADSQSTGLNEESWRARDIVYVRQLKMSSTGRQLLNQRERYRARICELFPNIRVLDGMPVLTHGEKR